MSDVCYTRHKFIQFYVFSFVNFNWIQGTRQGAEEQVHCGLSLQMLGFVNRQKENCKVPQADFKVNE